MKTYKVVLQDTGGFELSSTECEGLKQAKETARYYASEQFARVGAESTHEAMCSDRVIVTESRTGGIVFDLPVNILAGP